MLLLLLQTLSIGLVGNQKKLWYSQVVIKCDLRLCTWFPCKASYFMSLNDRFSWIQWKSVEIISTDEREIKGEHWGYNCAIYIISTSIMGCGPLGYCRGKWRETIRWMKAHGYYYKHCVLWSSGMWFREMKSEKGVFKSQQSNVYHYYKSYELWSSLSYGPLRNGLGR